MILFFRTPSKSVMAVECDHALTQAESDKLCWLFGEATPESEENLKGHFVGPRREMITPWSTNAVEITQNMGLSGISRIEEYFPVKDENADRDPMLQRMYKGLDQEVFTTNRKPEPIVHIEDLEAYNEKEGLALSKEEMDYLKKVEQDLGRKLTDSEVFGFAQINSEHCRHKIFGGTFIIDGVEQESSLFQMIKKTTQENPNKIISAYKDNVAFAEGPVIEQFAPADHSKPDYFQVKDIKSVISLKAETHNFPTTVEPFNGASTGTGGEIRDRMGGGKGSWPIAGTAVYMTSYPRTDEDRPWEEILPVRQWLYQTPEQILIKASNGASDFGNKFGQPLICGSVLTFEHTENNEVYGYDKVIMLAGGVGYGTQRDCLKGTPEAGNKVVVIGGDNYRIGLGGGSVSSVDTGRYSSGIELNAVQRANAEMQKRANNVVRALCEEDVNPVVSIHDHGSAGHVNCLSELVEECGGLIDMSKLPIGDKTLSAKEIIANESQERMGLLIKEEAIEHVRKIAERERAPMYVVGETTGDHRFAFQQADGVRPFDLAVEQMFGSSPKTYMIDKTVERHYEMPKYELPKLHEYLTNVLQLEAVACKDWLTNKVDRSVSGRIVRQQCVGPLHLPLSDVAAVSLDYSGHRGIATSIGHAPVAAMADAPAGSRLAIAEALTNLVWAPIEQGLKGISLSANWMWPCRNEGEDARLYQAVQAASDFAIELGVNIPTGKDSLSMTQKYGDKKVYAPGTVIISTVGEVTDFRKIVIPVLKNDPATEIVYVDFSFDKLKLGGSSFAQILNKVGKEVPDVRDSEYFARAFTAIQQLVDEGIVLAGHDISAGGMVTALLEMCFADNRLGLDIDFSFLAEKDMIKILFAENPGVLIQIADKDAKKVSALMDKAGVAYAFLGKPGKAGLLNIKKDADSWSLDIPSLRDLWFKTSYLLDRRQSGEEKALERYKSYKHNELKYKFPQGFTGKLADLGLQLNRTAKSGIRAAVIREKGCQCERETAWALHLAGFDVKDVHMTDLISGRETLEEVNMIVFVGGFSNSDVLGSAKGWAGAFKFNEKARQALENFYKREDTLSLGICNGCQLAVELGLIYPEHAEMPKMLHNDSHKFESGFVNVTIQPNHSVMLKSLAGSRLGIWIAHGEGKFSLPYAESEYHIPIKYSYDAYPGNPNGSPFATAAICSKDGRHLAMMPHLERSIYPWNWAYYAEGRSEDEVSPWIEAFVNARKWIEEKVKA